MIGKTLGNYRIEQRIGEGGVGEVYRATDIPLSRTVAIKALRADLASQPKLVERFRSEARTLAQLNHPHIATLYALIDHDERLWMVMEYVRGQTFSALIHEWGAMPSDVALPLFSQALDGIGCAHEHGIVHRDIKASNMMLNDRDVVKVMDFGIARELGSEHITRMGHMVGTLGYMSPEQVRGKETDARSDIYSLGVLLYDMLTGRMPFVCDSDYELMRAQIEWLPPSPREFASDLPETLEQVLLRSLAKDPGKRFQSTEEFRTALQAATDGLAPSADGRAVASPGASESTRPDEPAPDAATIDRTAATRIDVPIHSALAQAWARFRPGGTDAPGFTGRVAAGAAIFLVLLSLGANFLLLDDPPVSAPTLGAVETPDSASETAAREPIATRDGDVWVAPQGAGADLAALLGFRASDPETAAEPGSEPTTGAATKGASAERPRAPARRAKSAKRAKPGAPPPASVPSEAESVEGEAGWVIQR